MILRFSLYLHFFQFSRVPLVKLGVLFFNVVLCSGVAWATEKQKPPAWEVGAALGGQVLRDYRGSKEEQVQVYPIPFLIYRGDFLKADRNGVRGEFLANDRIELNISGETALNGSSDDNKLRRDMPELESAFELGPSLNFNLTGKDFNHGWQLRIPLRAVATIGNTGTRFIGYNFNPRFTYSHPRVFGRWKWKVSVGGLHGSQKYHDYYYSVEQKYVTGERPFYRAEAGYSGHYFKTSLTKRHADYIFGFALRYDNLSAATFRDSPLVETKDYFAFSFMLAWTGLKSN
ncbi:MAG: MipA/OmpV family protein [Agarilytica sp.]